MKGAASRNITRAEKDSIERRTVPGPRSKALFDREAAAMAPGLQSIALYSQIAVDRAQGCTIYDVDGNEYLDFIAGIAVGSVGHCHPHYVKRISEQLTRSTFGSFTTEARARFLALVSNLLPQGITHVSSFPVAPRPLRRPSDLPNPPRRNLSSSVSGVVITARLRA